MSGFIDPFDGEVNPSPEPEPIEAEDSDDDATEDDTDDTDDAAEGGLDLEEVARRFDELEAQLRRVQSTIESKGRASTDAEEELKKLAVIFSPFKLSPKYFDDLVLTVRESLDAIRVQERNIMTICTRKCRMDRKTFIKNFQGYEGNLDWVDAEIANG
jgi:RNA polymerase primary sigma factor